MGRPSSPEAQFEGKEIPMDANSGDLNTENVMSIWNSKKYLSAKWGMYHRNFKKYGSFLTCSETRKVSCIHFPPLGQPHE